MYGNHQEFTPASRQYSTNALKTRTASLGTLPTWPSKLIYAPRTNSNGSNYVLEKPNKPSGTKYISNPLLWITSNAKNLSKV